MNFKHYEKYEPLIARLFMGIPLVMWGIQKITSPAMGAVYVEDFQSLIFLNPQIFLFVVGIPQIFMGMMAIVGFCTRWIAGFFVSMGLVTFIVPGLIVLDKPYKFAYGLVMAGLGISLLIRGGGAFSVDEKRSQIQSLKQKYQAE